ncbi:MAG: sigma-70 family RNA polymerase sigma factor [Lachnospiraceae bacterium]|nr:sigma-70 family RNA polymerase sigma factor [Lachnospiraceae bacterium]
MRKSEEELLRRLCKEPTLYFEAYRILGKKKEAEEACITVLERIIEIYPALKRTSYEDLSGICQMVIQYLCVKSVCLDREEIKKNTIRSEKEFLALVNDCDKELIMQAIYELPRDKRCVLTLKYVFGLGAHAMSKLLGLSHYEVLKELKSSKATMITKMENLYECQKCS